jgi:hypothetical protein
VPFVTDQNSWLNMAPALITTDFNLTSISDAV